jgi:alanine dehydrogenase
MKIGIFKTSRKENEFRIPIYPEQFPWIPETLRQQLVLEENYGADYGFPNEYFTGLGATLATRERLFAECPLLVIPKPVIRDYQNARPGQVVFGWHHCVQQKDVAQAAIDRKLTLISWEAMHSWSQGGEKLMHIFYKNNEIAGYAGVLHCLQILGLDGHYGPRRNVVVLSYGSVSRGAIYALQGRGFNNIHVFTRRPSHLVADQNPDVYYGHYYPGPDGRLVAVRSDGTQCPLIDELAGADIICNGVLQDTNAPLMFVQPDEVKRLKPRSLIIDISCDEGMGFPFAKPTTFANPVFQVGERINYYSVDHIPSYLWNASSREISRALLPWLDMVAKGPDAWAADTTLRLAVEFQDGVIRNPNILRFQRRSAVYPHPFETVQ